MARRSSKNASTQAINFVLNGGLNHAQSPADIMDNELKRTQNWIYDPSTDYLVVRPGTLCQTAATVSDTAIRAIYYYEQSTTVGYLVAAIGAKLYYLSGASLNAWTEIGALTDATTVPSFVTYNAKLIIADGGTDLRTWDGTTYTTIGSSPQATALAVIKNRVVANMTTEPDSVYLSTSNDCESGGAWNTAGSAIGLRAGYGDNMAVVGFEVLGDDLIVFKVGDKGKRTMRVNVADATASSWYVQNLSENSAAIGAQHSVSAYNNVFFADTNGFKSLAGVMEYGDIQVDPRGRRINSVFSDNTVFDGVWYLPVYNAIWIAVGDVLYCYTERYNAGTNSYIPSFTDVYFSQGRIRSIATVGSTTYLAGNNGYLYTLNEDTSTDETAPDTYSTYSATARTKTMTFGVDGLLKRLQFYLKPIIGGTAVMYVCTSEEDKTLVKSVTLAGSGDYLYDATGYLDDATGYLYDTGVSAWVETTRNRIRHDEMAFELQVTTGRCGFEWVRAEIAVLEGGE